MSSLRESASSSIKSADDHRRIVVSVFLESVSMSELFPALLRSFVVITYRVEAASFRSRKDIAQPSLSRQISSFEREIDVQLFDRRSRKVFLTDAGQRFLREARGVL